MRSSYYIREVDLKSQELFAVLESPDSILEDVKQAFSSLYAIGTDHEARAAVELVIRHHPEFAQTVLAIIPECWIPVGISPGDL